MIFWYFGILIVLAALSQIEIVLSLSTLLIVPGVLLVSANTLLLYSALLLPFFINPRGMMKRPLLALLALVPTVIVAIGTPSVSHIYRDAFIARQHSNEAVDRISQTLQPRTLAIVVASSANLACNEECERLLYNREVEKIVKVYWSGKPLEGTPQTIAYRVEQHSPCRTGREDHHAYSPGAQARMAAGECIVSDKNADAETVDVTLSERPLYYSGGSWPDPRSNMERLLFTLDSIVVHEVSAGGPRTGKPMLHRTIVAAQALAAPLHLSISSAWMTSHLAFARSETGTSGYEMERFMKQRLGLRLEPVANP